VIVLVRGAEGVEMDYPASLPRRQINWADSGPGLSWPADYNLVWLPTYDRFVLTYSADSPDAFGYCDFALGTVAAEIPGQLCVSITSMTTRSAADPGEFA
jgi:hypothetical protein